MITMPVFSESENKVKSGEVKEEDKKEVAEPKDSQEESHDSGVGIDAAFHSFYLAANSHLQDTSQTSGYEYNNQPAYTPSLPYCPGTTVPGFYSYAAPTPTSSAYAFPAFATRPPFYGAPMPQTGFGPNPIGYGQRNARYPRTPGVVNYHAQESHMMDGSDLPMNDVSTLRFFYNEGVRSFNQNKLINRVASQVSNITESPSESNNQQLDLNHITSSLETNLKIGSNEENHSGSPFGLNKNSDLNTPNHQYDNRRDREFANSAQSNNNNNDRRYNRDNNKRRGSGRGGGGSYHHNGRNIYSRSYENTNRSGYKGTDNRNDNFKSPGTTGISNFNQNSSGDGQQLSEIGTPTYQYGGAMSGFGGGGYLPANYNQNPYSSVYPVEVDQNNYYMPQAYVPAPTPYGIYPSYPIAAAPTSNMPNANTLMIPPADPNAEGVVEQAVYPYAPPLVYGAGQPQMGYFVYPQPATYLPPLAATPNQMYPVPNQYTPGFEQPLQQPPQPGVSPALPQ